MSLFIVIRVEIVYRFLLKQIREDYSDKIDYSGSFDKKIDVLPKEPDDA